MTVRVVQVERELRELQETLRTADREGLRPQATDSGKSARGWNRCITAVGCALVLSDCAAGRAFRTGETTAQGGT